MANEFIARKGLIALDDSQITGSLDISLSLTASGLQYPDTDGVDRQVIKTDGNGVLSFGYSENTTIAVKNVSGGTILKGTPCYVTASGTSGNVAGIIPADAGDITKMPASIIAGETLSDEAEGAGLLNGFIQGVDTSQFTSGDTVYVAVGGGYTNVKPTGSGVYIQKLGNVEKVDVSNGSGNINGPGYYNELPNWETGKVMVGTDTYPVTSSIISLDESNTKVTIEGSGSTVFEVIGSEGQLFSITDSLSGSLFAVSDVSGLPILEVFSDDVIVAGAYNQNDFVITGSKIGIGTNTPGEKLEVIGNISASGDLYSNHLLLPQGADAYTAGLIFGELAGDSGYIYDAGNKLHIGYNDRDIISIHDTGEVLLVGGNTRIVGNITASGNISASGTLTSNTIISSQITGSDNAAIEIGTYNFGYEAFSTIPITGSGIIIRKDGISANNYPMLKIGDVELLDINPTFEDSVFLIRNVDRFLVTSGSEPVNIYAQSSGRLFEHDGDKFSIYIDGGIKSIMTADSASGVVINSTVTSQKIQTGASVNTDIKYLAGWSGLPSTPTSELDYIPTSSIIPAYAITSSYALNGVTINNNTDNRIITATGTANTLNGEANFTINSGEFNVGTNGYITYTPGNGGRKSGVHYDVDGNWEAAEPLFAGTTVKVGTAISTTAGKVYQLSGSWAESDAKQANTSTYFLGVAIDTGTTNTFLKEGVYSLPSTNIGGTYLAGAPLYLSTTTGAVTFTAPTGTGEIVRIIGYALDSYTSGTTYIKVSFNPSNDWIELA